MLTPALLSAVAVVLIYLMTKAFCAKERTLLLWLLRCYLIVATGVVTYELMLVLGVKMLGSRSPALFEMLWLLIAIVLYLLSVHMPGDTRDKHRHDRAMIIVVMSTIIAAIYGTSVVADMVAEGAYARVAGSVASMWSMSIAGIGLVSLWRRSKLVFDERFRHQIMTFVIVCTMSALVVALYRAATPFVAGAQFRCLAAVAVLFPAVTLSYSCLFSKQLKLGGIAMKIVCYSTTYLLFLLIFFAVIVITFPDWSQSAPSFVMLGLWASLAGLLHFRVAQPRVDAVFFQSPRHRGPFEAAFLAVTHKDLDFVLLTILQSLKHRLDFEKAFVVTSDRRKGLRVSFLGTPPVRVRRGRRQRDLLIRSQLHLPAAVADELSRLLLLESGSSLPFAEGSEPARRYPRVMTAARDLLRSFQVDGFRVVLPLLFGVELWGYIVLGSKSNRLPYFAKELEFLDSIRLPVALAVRNQTRYDEMGTLREKAQSEADRLTDQVVWHERADMKEAIRVGLKGGRSLVYRSQAVGKVVTAAERCAENRLPVLIRGETGTGKELIAEIIHERSQETGPFIPVNCAAIPATLWESVVFGHERGAFTDAKERRRGLVEDASGGTLFFDEIGEMPMDVQPKILRLIQEKQYSRVGSTSVLPVKCRLVFSTHRDLEGMISRGEFREDLYYRINVLTIEMPPLRERKPDIPLLIKHFIKRYGKDLNREVKRIDASSMEVLSHYAWPGNVRELENAVLRIITHTSSDRITVADLPSQIAHEAKKTIRLNSQVGNGLENGVTNGTLDFERMVNEYSKDLIAYALQKHRGNKTRTAQALGISRGKLKYQIRQLGIV